LIDLTDFTRQLQRRCRHYNAHCSWIVRVRKTETRKQYTGRPILFFDRQPNCPECKPPSVFFSSFIKFLFFFKNYWKNLQ